MSDDLVDNHAPQSDTAQEFSVTAELYVSSAAATVLRKVCPARLRYRHTDLTASADSTQKDCDR
jgi:hypothetical protein